MTNDVRDIMERLAAIEARTTPVSVKHGLNQQQKGVPQMPALFKPKHISVLGSKTDPKHPADGYMVGASESQGMASEEILSKVKKGLMDYLASVEVEKKDRDLGNRPADRDLGQRARDRDIVVRMALEDPTQTNNVVQAPAPVETYIVTPESVCVKSMTMEDGSVMEIHGDDNSGYGVRCGTRGLPTRFKSMSDAEMACDMYMARSRRAPQALSQDYMEEA
jgi:hypothetical protein